MLLGSLGWFRVPALLVVNGVIIGLGWFVRPFFAEPPSLRIGWPTVAGALVVLAWSGSVILQLGSPVVPFIDVLPNHVAPAQHLAHVRGLRRAHHRSITHLRPLAHVPGLYRAPGLGHRPERAACGAGRGRVHPARHGAGRRGHGPPGVGNPRRRRGLVDAARVHPDRVVRPHGRRAGHGHRPRAHRVLPRRAAGGRRARATVRAGRGAGGHGLLPPAGRRPDRSGGRGHGRDLPRPIRADRRAGAGRRRDPGPAPGGDHGCRRPAIGPGPGRDPTGHRRRVAVRPMGCRAPLVRHRPAGPRRHRPAWRCSSPPCPRPSS